MVEACVDPQGVWHREYRDPARDRYRRRST